MVAALGALLGPVGCNTGLELVAPGDLAGADLIDNRATDGLGPANGEDLSNPSNPPPDGSDLGGVDLSHVDINADALPSGVVEGPCHGCAWRRGEGFCWGANNFGELGDGTRTSREVAMPVSGLGSIVQMSVGCGDPSVNGHTCALTATDELWCWGADGDGQLGDQTNTDQLVPEKIRTLPAMASVSLGPRHSCALARDGRVFCWGNNEALTIGDGSNFNRPAPTLAKGLTTVVELSAGYAHNCARLASGALACWGANPYGECGTGDTFGVSVPTIVLPGITDAVQIAAGINHSCVRRGDGTAWCWGGGQYGALGNGTSTKTQLTPVQVELSFSPVEIASVFAQCARDVGGAVACWGSTVDSGGFLVINASPAPVPIANALSLGGSCATRPGGEVSCWGFNHYGQLGDGTMMDRAAPVDVVGLTW